MTTETEIYFPGAIQNKFQFCARTNTFITAVLPHSRGGSSALLPYSQEFMFSSLLQNERDRRCYRGCTHCLCLEGEGFRLTSSYVFSAN